MNTTFVIIKPDAIERGFVGQIITRFEDMGLYIVRIEKRTKNKMWCRLHYEDINIVEVYNRLENCMCSSPLIGIVLSGECAVARVRRMIGVTDALIAVPGTIRGDFGKYSGPHNLVHASDSIEAVLREVELFFDKDTDV